MISLLLPDPATANTTTLSTEWRPGCIQGRLADLVLSLAARRLHPPYWQAYISARSGYADLLRKFLHKERNWLGTSRSQTLSDLYRGQRKRGCAGPHSLRSSLRSSFHSRRRCRE